MITRKLNAKAAAQKPDLVWNEFVDLLVMEEYENLTEVQRVAHLAFWYDSEVQNGGHLQYFLNRGTDLLNETVSALGVLGAWRQTHLLKTAGEAYMSRNRTPPTNAVEFVAEALKREFGAADSAYYGCEPSMTKLLGGYLGQHLDSFVELV